MRWIYERDEKNLTRYALGQINNESGKTLLCFGINPSTASPEKLDNTINKIINISKFNGYENWIMLNIYPQRATNPDDIHKEPNKGIIEKNYTVIENIINTYTDCDVLYAYGNLISKRVFLWNCLNEITLILQNNHKRIKVLKLTKEGNPYHPLYAKKETILVDLC